MGTSNIDKIIIGYDKLLYETIFKILDDRDN